MKAVLVDTGALVALFDHSDVQFEHYRTLFSKLLAKRVRLMSTWPCITEASYILSPLNHMVLLEWLKTRAVTIQHFETEDVQDMLGWMRKYTERGKSIMDFADASLYWLAVQMNSPVILSVDIKDFSRYKLPDGRGFEIL